LKENLAKLYGNLNPKRIVVEGCSRTDKGVHATGMIAHIYCLKELQEENETTINSAASIIPGKKLPHPASSTDDTYFERIPMNGKLSKIAFSLNRMRPSDVQVTGIAPTPDTEGTIFHASTSTISKTYEYTISTGSIYDPTMSRHVWHVTYSQPVDIELMKQACQVLQGTHNFIAFRGSPRGTDDKRRFETQDTICTLFDVSITEHEPPFQHGYFDGVVDPPLQTYKFHVTGDRFLYRMVRFIVGSCVAVGSHTLTLDDIRRALETGTWDIPNDQNGRRKEFECAPAHGLVLRHVNYGDYISFDWQPLRELE
jgi:tRNA pseudouridine38-40 synthase